MAAVLLALEHLNTGNGTLVEEVGGLDERCNIKFTSEFKDTALSESESLNHVVELTGRSQETELPAAYVGAFRSACSMVTSLVTGLRGIPQISPVSTSSHLNDVGQYPLFGRTVPSDDGTAVPAIKYLREQLGVRHLAILYVNDSYGNAYTAGMQLAAALHAPDMTIHAFDLPITLTPDVVENAVSVLKSSGYLYFFGIFDPRQYEPIMTEAYHQGIAGDGEHNWMFSDALSTSVTQRGIDANSPLRFAIQGSIQIAAVGGVPGRDPRYDLFLQSLRDLRNSVDMATLQSYHPTYPDEPEYYVQTIAEDPESYFSRVTTGSVPFMYDAVIALGLAACNVDYNETDYFDGYQHFEKFKETEFEGASGTIRFDRATGTRLADAARFTITNFVHMGNVGNTATFENVETDVFQDGEWINVEPRVFNDGTSNTPPDLPPVEPNNLYIGAVLRSIGIVITCSIWAISMGLALWMACHREAPVVRASQPIFLGIIALGCFLMGTSIIFLSLDDEVVSTETCSAFCILVPWFFSFGWILSFSALYAKTYRVNKIFHNPKCRRMKVTVKDVMAPIFLLQTIANTILIVWYSTARPEWVRETTKEDLFGREIETSASCDYGGSTGFIISLCTLLLAVLFYTLQQAYAARDVSTEFAETEYIFLALAELLLVSFVGFPVLIIANDDTRARFYVSAAVIAGTCMSILVLIFFPKVAAFRSQHERTKRTREYSSQAGSDRVRISGFSIMTRFGNGSLDEDDGDSIGNVSRYSRISRFSRVGSGEDDKAGVKVVQHPQENEKLKKTVAELQSKNKKLMAQVSRLAELHKKTAARLDMSESELSESMFLSTTGNLGNSSAFLRLPAADSRGTAPTHDGENDASDLS
ncbi:unnamed protein product [Cylindrotheca closterium]|uniref:G-protein coupled receptors family 3 profile domain-containing protein n=1 Tax=Cylindrotheca closterium TaxID=2856 RepID=A0AAD2CJD9_9STRA|nr:unnamed protein product [Cylindrotheca closterium]